MGDGGTTVRKSRLDEPERRSRGEQGDERSRSRKRAAVAVIVWRTRLVQWKSSMGIIWW